MIDNENDNNPNILFCTASVYWCDVCCVPVILKEEDKHLCPLCGEELVYMARDTRPVFPEERLLFELFTNRPPMSLAAAGVWAHGSQFFIDNKKEALSRSLLQKFLSTGKVCQLQGELENLKEHNAKVSASSFKTMCDAFARANAKRLLEMEDEAFRFIKAVSSNFSDERIVVSFSGGKDSTVTADLTVRALGRADVVHIFGDTTLEFPMTLDYAKRFRMKHPNTPFIRSCNEEQNFMDMCTRLGPPARMMRWCCSMFKTGPISRGIESMYGNDHVLTLYGIRRVESVRRSHYNRVERASDDMKIRRQTVASPIFNWKDIDVWLYIISHGLDFNTAYRLGYDRVGCWCCPNNNTRDQFLSSIYMADKMQKWRDFLVNFALSIGKKDAEIYVDSGAWKARQGGNGVEGAEDASLVSAACATDENAFVYRLTRPFDDGLAGMFTPLGIVSKDLGNRLTHEVLVLDAHTKVPILSVRPHVSDKIEYAVRVSALGKDKDTLHRKASYQVRKFNACRKCLKCESVCSAGAIHINENGYFIDADKCVRCGNCIDPSIIDNGCMMSKFLRLQGVS